MIQMKVDPIRNGTVIDHIAPGKALQVVEVLKLNGSSVVMIGVNLASARLGRKDLIKIEDRELSQSERDTIALISPSATCSIIKEYQVARKAQVTMPKLIERLIVCPNPQCVTGVEQIPTRFHVESANPVMVRCAYCEKSYRADEVKISVRR